MIALLLAAGVLFLAVVASALLEPHRDHRPIGKSGRVQRLEEHGWCVPRARRSDGNGGRAVDALIGQEGCRPRTIPRRAGRWCPTTG